MCDYAGVDAESAGDEVVPGGHARRISAIAMRKDGGVLGQRIDGRRGWPCVAVTAKVVGAQTVNVEEEDSQEAHPYKVSCNSKGQAECLHPIGPSTYHSNLT